MKTNNIAFANKASRIYRAAQLTPFTSSLIRGGGGASRVCIDEGPQLFNVDFALMSYTAKVGEYTLITSTMSPQCSRDDARFDIKLGELPPGLKLVQGNVEGVPTMAGMYMFQMYISGVNGYENFSFAPTIAPRTGIVTVTVFA